MFSLSIDFYIINVLDAQKYHVNETVILSTNNIYFGCEIRKKEWGQPQWGPSVISAHTLQVFFFSYYSCYVTLLIKSS